MSAAFCPLSLCRSFTRPRPLSKTPLDNSKSPRFVGLLNSSSETNLWRVVHSQLRHNFVCRFLRMSGECAQNLQTLHKYTTDDNHANQNHRRGRDQSRETPKHTQLSCRRQESPTSMDYRSGERARITMRPPYKYARSQGTPSPQISVTFRTL